mgnify:CR=1 FL=1|jgi:hypothetical protein|tara:strand:- start:208 stop:576 length:369 start_codon:yes stop_codon:yes gene_type:complete
MAGLYQNQIPSLSKLNKFRYENIFKVYIDDSNNRLIYNLNTSINFPEEISPDFFDQFTLDRKVPWTTISYNIYSTIHLWWMITELNRVSNPIIMPKPGTVYKYIKPNKVNLILNQIESLKNG